MIYEAPNARIEGCAYASATQWAHFEWIKGSQWNVLVYCGNDFVAIYTAVVDDFGNLVKVQS